MIGDGQVSHGSQVLKDNERKVRQLKEGVYCGFAGSTADAMTLFERLEAKLSEHPETMRACVEMAKNWRMDKYLRKLEAVMIVVDADVQLQLTGTGDVFDTDNGIIGIGSGGSFATAAGMPTTASLSVLASRFASSYKIYIKCMYAHVLPFLIPYISGSYHPDMSIS